jgi:elongation factor P--(R)-beta-lysine ligase
MKLPNDQPTFAPSASLAALEQRSTMLRKLREFFYARSFIEVETPLLATEVIPELHIEPMAVEADSPGTATSFLQASPELHMKCLLAAGATAIFQVTRSFRAGERGPLHNPEFTIVEWYRLGDGYHEGMQLLSDLGEALLGRGRAERMTYAAAFQTHIGVNPHTASMDELRRAAEAHGLRPPQGLGDDRDGWLNLLLAECVEKHLGRGKPTILFDYPPSQAALACVRDDPCPIAERFELYVEGIELANGYHELVDAGVLRERNHRASLLRAADGKPELPEDSRLLSAMDAGLPPCCGCALGFDRVVMLAAGVQSIDEVISFPIDRA